MIDCGAPALSVSGALLPQPGQRLHSPAALAHPARPRPLIPLRARPSLAHGTGSQLAGLRLAGAPVSKALLNVLLQGGVSNTQKMLPAALDEWAVCPFHTDVSLSPLIPPLGPRRVQALPARISVSSLLSPCVAAPPCQCHPRLALPSLPGQPGVVGERSPLAASREGPVPAESPLLARRCAEMAAQPLRNGSSAPQKWLPPLRRSRCLVGFLSSSLPLLLPTRVCGEGNRLPCCGWLYL